MVSRYLVMLSMSLALLSGSCVVSSGYRLSAGATVDSDGAVAATVRVGGQIGVFGEALEPPKDTAGMTMVAEAVGSSNGEVGVGGGFDFVRLKTFAGRLGFRSEVTSDDGQRRGSVSLASGIARRIKRERKRGGGEYLLGAELRAGGRFTNQENESNASLRFFLGASLERNKYRRIKGPRIGK